jgi:hypothetical protein
MTRSVAIGLLLAALCCGQEGTAVFISRCIQCHDANSDSHAPLPDSLANRPWQDIVKALETGSMKAIGAQLSAADKLASRTLPGEGGVRQCCPRLKGFCAAGAKPRPRRFLEWVGVDEKNTRFQPAKAAGLSAGTGSWLESEVGLRLPQYGHRL